MRMTIASGNASGKVEVEIASWKLAIILGIIAVVPAGVTAVTEAVMKPSTKAIENVKLNLERRKASAELYRLALRIEDPGKRHKAVQFLFMAKLVDENTNVMALLPGEIPHWPATTETSP